MALETRGGEQGLPKTVLRAQGQLALLLREADGQGTRGRHHPGGLHHRACRRRDRQVCIQDQFPRGREKSIHARNGKFSE